jgi:hypothetical protein
MTTATPTYDVFLSHSSRDKHFAADVANRLKAEGLEPFYDASIQVGETVSEAIWDALAECHAFIVIVSPDSSLDAMGMVELGAAAAWNKPIFVLLNGPASLRLPDALQSYRAYPLNRVDEILGQIRHNLEPISDDERKVLAETYRDVNVSADELGQSPGSLRKLVEQFNAKTHKHLSGDRLLSELLRMRKQAKLPRLSRQPRAAKS